MIININLPIPCLQGLGIMVGVRSLPAYDYIVQAIVLIYAPLLLKVVVQLTSYHQTRCRKEQSSECGVGLHHC